MNTQTKTLLGLAAVAGVGYLVYKNMQDKKKTTMSFAGMDYNTVVGDRKRMVGLVAANKNVQDSGWVRADGASIAPTFFDVQSSGWIRSELN